MDIIEIRWPARLLWCMQVFNLCKGWETSTLAMVFTCHAWTPARLAALLQLLRVEQVRWAGTWSATCTRGAAD